MLRKRPGSIIKSLINVVSHMIDRGRHAEKGGLEIICMYANVKAAQIAIAASIIGQRTVEIINWEKNLLLFFPDSFSLFLLIQI
jgi:hypothetical protein